MMNRNKKISGNDPATIVIYDRKRKQMFHDTSLLAFHKPTNKIVAVGEEAAQLMDNKEGIEVICPLKNGVIADYTASQAMFRMLLKKTQVLRPIFKPMLAVCAPADITQVEYKAFQDTFYQAGAKKVLISDETVERLDQTLPSSYPVIIGILRENKRETIQKETWSEAGHTAIPSGIYHTVSIYSGPSGMNLSLSSDSHCVQMCFHEVSAVRMLDQQVAPDLIDLENQGQHVLYQIKNGEWIDSLKENGRGRDPHWNKKDFIILSSEYVLEVIAEREPEVSVSDLREKP